MLLENDNLKVGKLYKMKSSIKNITYWQIDGLSHKLLPRNVIVLFLGTFNKKDEIPKAFSSNSGVVTTAYKFLYKKEIIFLIAPNAYYWYEYATMI